MFERLSLKAFGRFADTNIELGSTTALVGGNDSGKTTLFDAITSALAGQEPNRERYGDEARSHLEGGGTLANDHDLTLLHAIPAAGAPFEARDPEAIDARLRAGLISLRTVASQLAAMASDDAENPHNRDIEQLRTTLDALSQQWQATWDRRIELGANLAEAERLTEELDALDAQIAHQRERAAHLAAAIEMEQERQRMSERRDEILVRQELVTSHREDAEALDELTHISDAELAKLDALQEDLSAHLGQVSTIEARQIDGRRRLEAVAVEIEDARRHLPGTKRAAERATATRLRLERFLAQPKQVVRQEWHSGRVVAALAFFAIGMACATFLAGTVHFVGLGLGMTLGTCTLAFGRQTIREEDDAGAADFITQLCGEWNREPGLPRMHGTTPEQVVSFCAEHITAYQNLTTILDQQVTYKTRVEEEVAHILDRSHTMLLTTLPARQNAVSTWMRENNCYRRDQYAEQVRSRKVIEARMAARHLSDQVPQDMEQLTALEEQLATEIEALATQDLDSPRTGGEMAAMVLEHTDSLGLCEQLETRRGELAVKLDDLDTNEPRDLTNLLHQIEREQQRVEATLAELAEDKRTAAAAHRMVQDLADTPDLHWSLLNETLTSLLTTAGLDGWKISIEGLAETQVRITDPRGGEGTLATQGSGAHDLMALACRLALAAELDGDALPFLVLEEPFARLDDENTAAAVALLDAFQARTGWQIVLITRPLPTNATSRAATRVVDLGAA